MARRLLSVHLVFFGRDSCDRPAELGADRLGRELNCSTVGEPFEYPINRVRNAAREVS